VRAKVRPFSIRALCEDEERADSPSTTSIELSHRSQSFRYLAYRQKDKSTRSVIASYPDHGQL